MKERCYEFTSYGPRHRGADWIAISERDFRERETRVDLLTRLVSTAPLWSSDLLRIARAVFLVDKRFLRSETADRWTRVIRLSVQLNEPETWTPSVLETLNTVLAQLTGDHWSVEVHPGATAQTLLDDEPVGEVALFSGGLDSTAYAAHAVRNATTPLLLISFDDGLQSRQQEIRRYVEQISRRPVTSQQLAQTVQSEPGEDLEPSSRSRGFLYLAAAVCSAASHRLERVSLPENGQLAVNPPLTPGRLGALSTRSAHPNTIALLNQVIRGVGGTVRVTNPLLDRTKGEVCALALESGLTAAALGRTISCGNPRRTKMKADFNCGYCYPCLLRRAGLLQALGEDPTEYQHNVADLPIDDRKARDLTALAQWLNNPFGLRDVVADSPYPDEVPPPAVLPVLLRGRTEFSAMLTRVLPADHPLRTASAGLFEGDGAATQAAASRESVGHHGGVA
ncbi:7-cyano-7-deazaguanine synthase [Actinophytocola xanthii]|uniref:7-cyano-7-deazaguanine synthase n=1 Tax=Actinophytocola xanthii TaxID=1912961 RepID=A0A1Q8CKZ5_9PSEU|nr:7-cyano-7-deazaguanine synthase [Actinophytocola xanthii]OLF15025.1 hypothetical protein BU204_24320 [Actinophytocola xanthii]